MGLKSLLRRFLPARRDPTAYKIDRVSYGDSSLKSAVEQLATETAELRNKVDALEALQVSREIEWRETRDKLLRYLKRLQELDRRTHQDEDSPGANSRTAQVAAVLGMKFPNGLPTKGE